MDFEKCREKTKHKIITVSENKRKFSIQNINQIKISTIKVDGCLINDNQTERCDYLFEFEIENKKQVFYVELKGADIKKAACQLTSTIKICQKEHYNRSKSCYIVASRVPKAGTAIQILKRKMRRDFKTSLYVATNQHTQKVP